MSIKPTSSVKAPFRFEFGEQIGAGKDNKVYEFKRGEPQDKRFPRFAGETVVKVSVETQKGDYMTPEQAILDAKYKKAKYELLRTFLGDYIPETSFAVGHKVTGGREVGGRVVGGTRRVPKSYTVQERKHQFMLHELPKESRNSDVLRSNFFGLVTRLQTMHQVLRRASAIVEGQGQEFLVEDSLDLGPLSDFVRGHMDDNPDTFNLKHMINGYKSSPNLVVDPDTLTLSCIDFGKGQWSDELGAQMGLVYDIIEHDPDVQAALNPQL